MRREAQALWEAGGTAQARGRTPAVGDIARGQSGCSRLSSEQGPEQGQMEPGAQGEERVLRREKRPRTDQARRREEASRGATLRTDSGGWGEGCRGGDSPVQRLLETEPSPVVVLEGRQTSNGGGRRARGGPW